MDPFIYQYGLGAVVFAVGLTFAARQGYVGTSGKPLRNLLMMLGGLGFFASLQGWLQYAPMETAEAVPYTGDGLPTGMMGTGLDYGVMITYFVAILGIGTWFGRKQKSTKDFFFAGQRFSWWLIAFSLIATTIGSYSFVKYSKIAYNYGLASSQTYLNDWFWLPLFIFGWLPLLYFSRLTSIPEYFERRFGRSTRNVVTVLLLVYLIGYVGVNLFTMGKALNILLGWDVFWGAVCVACISAVYVTFGGQTSVIMTDLFQGIMLLATGAVIIYLGAEMLGGMEPLWEHMPRDHRKAFTNFNVDPAYHSVGIFWQDAMANSATFYFLNQGMLMRFMAARSVEEGRKAVIAVLVILMPIAAVVVASGGWVGKALEHAGILPPGMDGGEVFFITSELLARPGVFGLIMAALTAALMSTVDTLITAIAAIVVNDIYKPLRPESNDQELLRVARYSSVGVTLLGISLVPIFNQFDSIYAAHGAFTAAVTPPLVVALLLSVFWRRFTEKAALATLVGGTLAIVASIRWPELVAPFAHGVPAREVGDGFFEGAKQYKYMRALYGLSVSSVFGVVVALATTPPSRESQRGLVWGTVSDALRYYKGSEGTESASKFIAAALRKGGELREMGSGQLPAVTLSSGLANLIAASVGDIVYVTDDRWWFGGLRASHGMVEAVEDDLALWASVPDLVYADVLPSKIRGVKVQRLC
jgi:SSS family solute:Na+ symporter